MDFKEARKNVIEQQIRPWGGLNVRANQALSDIPRENFVPEEYQKLVFADIEIPLNGLDKMLSPKIEGRILDSLNLQGNEDTLEVGTGSGYLTSVLAKLSNSVTSIEIEHDLYLKAKEDIGKLKLNNITLINEAFSSSNFKEAQFDTIVISSALPTIGDDLKKLLKVGGKLFVVVGSKNQMHATLISRETGLLWNSKSLFETHLEFMKGHEPSIQFSF
ncbi:protein-L-isoaspartate O-methyltransferase [Candidatus Thioglobus sp.]|jgi:protein-L-isoaspartate(D-aspartate) O-methyltransferase|nr:protein-L-isoaspartate O-methyltransferase [Candidatus Thioglobus sp.]|tara:strand:+ start:4478 stop:5131 length:654 start_codon:yes stop_codon:yes gene_type:complete